jgi:hypothetical protein
MSIICGSLETPCITSFRDRIRDLLRSESRKPRPRNIVLLGLDGIPYSLATRMWTSSATVKLRSVLPTTSSTGWLSSLTGLNVDAHGVPGVVFRIPDVQKELVSVFLYKGSVTLKITTAPGGIGC